MPRQNERELFRKIAVERINVLFAQAAKKYSKEPALSNRYVELARKIQKRYKVRIPENHKFRYCKSCSEYWIPGKSVRVRTKDGKTVFTCLNCGSFRRVQH